MKSFMVLRSVRALARRAHVARVFVAIASVGLFASACDVHGISEAGRLATITVTPNPKTLLTSGTQQFTAVGTDFYGRTVAITPVWTLVSGGGAISASGMFTGGTVSGTFTNTVSATSGGVTGTATVILTIGPIATIVVTPNPATLAIGGTQQFTAVGKDANGNVVTFTPTWTVLAGGGTMNSTGFFTAGTTSGTFTNTIQASNSAVVGLATVIDTPGPLARLAVPPNPAPLARGPTQQFTALGKDASGNVVAFTPAWSIVAGGGVIDPASGLFTAGPTVGTYTNTVKASSGAIAGFATVTVTPPPPALTSIAVTPNPASMNTAATQQFTATGTDQYGNNFPITPTWSVVNGGGTINSVSGLFTSGNTTGTFAGTVKATSGAVSGTATVIVSAVVIPPPNILGSAAPNGIMAGTAFTCVIGGVINANISISPGSTVTGFPPCVITGVQHLADAVAAQAQIDLTTAYNTLAGMPCPPANAIVANLGGTTKAAGVYCSATSIGVTGNLTLDGGGNPNAVFVFQAGTGLTTAGNVLLINGASAKNVYWLVGSSATIGTASQWQGNIVALTSITLVDNANLIGRALARNGAVSLGTNNVVTLP
jgi:hypothetical protein